MCLYTHFTNNKLTQEREEGGWSCPDSPVRCLTSPGGRSQPPLSPARQRLPSPTFPTRCVSPNSFSNGNNEKAEGSKDRKKSKACQLFISFFVDDDGKLV